MSWSGQSLKLGVSNMFPFYHLRDSLYVHDTTIIQNHTQVWLSLCCATQVSLQKFHKLYKILPSYKNSTLMQRWILINLVRRLVTGKAYISKSTNITSKSWRNEWFKEWSSVNHQLTDSHAIHSVSLPDWISNRCDRKRWNDSRSNVFQTESVSTKLAYVISGSATTA